MSRSAFKNAAKAQRRTHKERHQPKRRARLGLLEKRKDYLLRARDFNQKKRRLKALRERAALKNPDEFYFQMEKTRTTKKGRHVMKSGEGADATEMRKQREEDLRYASMKRAAESKKIERLRESLQFTDAGGTQSTHTVWVDSPKVLRSWSAEEHFDTLPELVDQPHHRPRKGDLTQPDFVQGGADTPKAIRKALKAKNRAYSELKKRLERKDFLTDVVEESTMHKALLGKGERKKVGSVVNKRGRRKKVYKWKRERKK